MIMELRSPLLMQRLVDKTQTHLAHHSVAHKLESALRQETHQGQAQSILHVV